MKTLVTLLALTLGPVAHAQVVNDPGDGPGPCTLASCTLRAALATGSPTVTIATSVPIVLNGEIPIVNAVTITPAFTGLAEIYAAAPGRIFDIQTGGAPVVLNSLRLQGGMVGDEGGAIRIRASTVTANGLEASGNHAQDGGAIACIDGCSLTVNTGLLDHNNAYARGGALYVANDSVATLNATLVADNHADGFGGGTYATDAAVVVDDGLHTGNKAAVGGGLFADRATLSLSDTAAIANRAENHSGVVGWGGGIGMWRSGGTFDTVQLADNVAEYGGNLGMDESAINMDNGSISSGQAVLGTDPTRQRGGGAWIRSSPGTTLTDVTVSSNIAAFGGGLAVDALTQPGVTHTVTLVGGSVVDNAATHDGGGLHLGRREGTALARGFGTVRLSGTSVLRNSAHHGGGLWARADSDTDALFLSRADVHANAAAGSGGALHHHVAEGRTALLDLFDTDIGSINGPNTATTGAGLHLGDDTTALGLPGAETGRLGTVDLLDTDLRHNIATDPDLVDTTDIDAGSGGGAQVTASDPTDRFRVRGGDVEDNTGVHGAGISWRV